MRIKRRHLLAGGAALWVAAPAILRAQSSSKVNVGHGMAMHGQPKYPADADTPDYVKWAEAMGCVGLRCENPEDVVPTIEKANAVDDRPVVIDFRVDYREKVYPMVAAGTANDDIILDPAHDTYGAR